MSKNTYLIVDNSIWVSTGIDYCREEDTLVFIAVPLAAFVKYKHDKVKMLGLHSTRINVDDAVEVVGVDVELLKALYE